MPTPFLPRHASSKSWSGAAKTKPATSHPEWRCTHCDKLLGLCRGARVHLRFSRGHEYFVGFPVTATCRGCGTLNRLTSQS